MPAKKNSTKAESPKTPKTKNTTVAVKGESASAGVAANDAARTAALAKLQKVEPVPALPPVVLKGADKAAKEPAKAAAATKGGKARNRKAEGPRTGGLTAAHQVLSAAKEPMNVRDITKAAMDKGLWKPGGKTPSATLAAAIGREIKDKGKQSRFKKTDRGLFIAMTPR